MPKRGLERAEQRQSRSVFFIRGSSQELAEYVKINCRKLLGSEAYVDRGGRIFYRRWPRLHRRALLPPSHVVISKLDKQTDIFAPYSRYTDWHKLTIHQVKKDGGAVETAIRNMDRILNGIREKEKRRSDTVFSRAQELFDLYSANFSTITHEEFAQAEEKTREMLAAVQLDPQDVIDEELERMRMYLVKGSSGRDSTGRENMIISLGALIAAYRRAVERRLGLDATTIKFTQMREAFIITREFDRSLVGEVRNRFAPMHFPALAMFREPEKRAYDRMTAVGILGTVKFQLEQTHVLPYRKVALNVLPMVDELRTLLKSDQRSLILQRGLFEKIYEPLDSVLDAHKDIYRGGVTPVAQTV